MPNRTKLILLDR